MWIMSDQSLGIKGTVRDLLLDYRGPKRNIDMQTWVEFIVCPFYTTIGDHEKVAGSDAG